MCLVAFYWDAERGRLVLISNRDELFARPTAQACWDGDGEVVCGRDLVAGGTWLGVTRGGLASLDTGATQIRATHFFRKVPGPPRLRMSRQGLHKPHSGARHGPQRPHADERARFFGGASAIRTEELHIAVGELVVWLGSVAQEKRIRLLVPHKWCPQRSRRC